MAQPALKQDSLEGIKKGDPVVVPVPEHGPAQGYYVRATDQTELGERLHVLALSKRKGKYKPFTLFYVVESRVQRGWMVR